MMLLEETINNDDGDDGGTNKQQQEKTMTMIPFAMKTTGHSRIPSVRRENTV